MRLSVSGFGHQVNSKEVAFGDVVLITRDPDVWVAMRVGYGAEPFDLLLAQLRGDPRPGVELPRVVELNLGQYTSIAGELTIRPTGAALPAIDGTLVLDSKGDAYFRKFANGVEHFELASGLMTRPGDGRTYYADWELVQRVGETERVLATFTAAPIG